MSTELFQDSSPDHPPDGSVLSHEAWHNDYSDSSNFPAAFSLVFIALILTLSIAAVDERIALYPHQPSLW